MVGNMAVGSCGVIGPAYEVAVGMEPGAVARTELGKGTSIGP